MPKSYWYSINFDTGGVDVSKWSQLSKEEREKAIKKPWRIVWYYRDPETLKMKRQTDIKAGVNRFKTMSERMQFLKQYKKFMIEVLEEGYNPFTYAEYEQPKKATTAEKAILEALEVKKSTVNYQTYKDYDIRAKEFLSYLKKQGRSQHDIKLISRKVVSDYLDVVLKRSSPRTRNNTRNVLSAIFTVMSDRFVIQTNFIKNDIPKLREAKKVDRRFKKEELEMLADHLQNTDTYFLTFLKLIAYNFMRPIEVCRITVGDVDLKNLEIRFDQKTKKGKVKRIPQILIRDLKPLLKYPEDHHLFTPEGKPAVWTTEDRDKRNYFSKKFRKLKKELGFETDMYGLRHYFVTDLYLYFRKEEGLSQERSIEAVTAITGHESREGVANYIHAHDIEKPEDWSDKINFKL